MAIAGVLFTLSIIALIGAVLSVLVAVISDAWSR